MSLGSDDTGTTGSSQRHPCAFWIDHETWIVGDRADYWRAAGWVTVDIMTCCILRVLVLAWWIIGRIVETVSNGTENSGRGRMYSRRPKETHDHGALQGRALQK